MMPTPKDIIKWLSNNILLIVVVILLSIIISDVESQTKALNTNFSHVTYQLQHCDISSNGGGDFSLTCTPW